MGLTEFLADSLGFVIPLFEDTCDLIDAQYISDPNGGETLDPASPVTATDLPCFYEAIRLPRDQQIGQAEAWLNKIRIILEASPVAYAIGSNYLIKVHPRTDLVRPEQVFEQPTVHTESFWPIVEIYATLKNSTIS